jgi:hypothetical protein
MGFGGVFWFGVFLYGDSEEELEELWPGEEFLFCLMSFWFKLGEIVIEGECGDEFESDLCAGEVFVFELDKI